MRLLQLSEKRETVNEIVYLVDPTARELMGFIQSSQYTTLRGFTLDGHTWWWDAMRSTHTPGVENLGYDDVDAYLVCSNSESGLRRADVSEPQQAMQAGPVLITAYRGEYQNVGLFARDNPFGALIRGLARLTKSATLPR